MAIVTLLPTGNTTPWAAIGGEAVTSPTNQGHASSSCVANDGDPFQNKTCLWGPFPSLPAGAASVKLKASWAYANASHNSPDSENLFQFFYNPTGSSAVGLQSLFAISDASGSDNQTVEATISLSQDMSTLFVMDIISATQITAGFTAQIDVTISNIRVEVTTTDALVIMM